MSDSLLVGIDVGTQSAKAGLFGGGGVCLAAWNLEQPNVLHVHRRGTGRVAGFTEVIACEADHPLAAAWWPSAHVLGWEHGHVNMLAHFVDAVSNGTTVEPLGAIFFDGMRAAQVAEAVERAAETGERVDVAQASSPTTAVGRA